MKLAERDLWQAVLHMALTDALPVGRVGDVYKARGDAVHQAQAQGWIAAAGRDFRQVCALAGFDADGVREAFTAGRIVPEALRRELPKLRAGRV